MRLTHRIYLLGRALTTAADKMLRAEFDMSFTEYLLLHGVETRKITDQDALGGFVGVGDAGVSRIVTRLVGRGLLTSSVNPENRRRSVLSATERGRRVLDKASAFLERRFYTYAEDVTSSADLKAFERVLDRLLDKMGANP
jgi:DNA-binding MarR family transcriptional regulator